VTILVSLLNFGRLSTIAAFVYTFSANAFFLVRLSPAPSRGRRVADAQLRSLKYVLLPDPSSAGAVTSASLSHAQRSRRVQFLFIMAMSQVLWMGWLSRV